MEERIRLDLSERKTGWGSLNIELKYLNGLRRKMLNQVWRWSFCRDREEEEEEEESEAAVC